MVQLNKWTLFAAIAAALWAVLLFATADAAHAQPTVVIETFEVDQANDLVDGQTISVTVDGAGGEGTWWVGQCALVDTDNPSCNGATEAAERGLLNGQSTTAEIVVSLRFSNYAGSIIDCLQVACSIVIYASEEPTAALPISFDAEAPRRPSASIAASPVSDLNDEAMVTLNGQGFEPLGRIDVSLCRESFDRTPCEYVGVLSASLEGDVSTSVSVPRTIVDFDSSLVDCAVEACELRFGFFHENYDGLEPSPIAIGFNDDEALPGPSTATVRPRRNLVDGQSVTVRMGDPDRPIQNVYQCSQHPTDPDQRDCHFLDADYSGQEKGVVVEVQRFLPYTSFDSQLVTTIDCAATPGQCELVVLYNYDSTNALVDGGRGLVFDPDIPAQTTTVRLKGRNKIVPNKLTEITFANNENPKLWVVQCPREATDHLDQRCVVAGARHNQNAQASGIIEVRPRRVVGVAGDLVDCAERRACDLRVVGSIGPIRRLLINLTGEPSDLPTIRVSTKRDLVDGQQVKVRVLANGYNAVVQQCVVGAEKGSGHCFKVGNLDARGFLNAEVSRFVQAVDCAAAPRVCELRVSVDNLRTDGARLIFEEVAPLATGVLAASASEGLVDSQSVEVTVRGHRTTHNSVFQCVTTRDLSGCIELAYFWQPTDLTQSTTMEVSLQRWVGTTDCATFPGACELVTGDYSGVFGTDKVAISFDYGSKTFTVRPRRNLVDAQNVSVTADLPKGHRVVVSQCLIIDGKLAERTCSNRETLDVPEANAIQSVGADQLVASLHTTNGITRQVDFRVRRLMYVSPGEPAWDCAATARSCGLNFTVQAPNGPSYEPESVNHIWLEFEDVPLPELGKVTVRPRRNLQHMQSVSITAEVPEALFGEISQCRLVEGELDAELCTTVERFNLSEFGELQNDLDDTTPSQWQTPDWLEQQRSSTLDPRAISATAAGLDGAIRVRRFLYDRSDDTRWDCASEPRSCALVVEAQYDSGHTSSKQVWLEFDDIAFEPATFTVSPRRNLAPNQQVDVRVENAESESYVALQCARDADRAIRFETCISRAYFFLAFGDEDSRTVAALRSLRNEDGEVVDCVGAIPSCVMVLYPSDDGLPPLAVALNFNSSRDALPVGPTTLYATPNVGLTIGTTVTVTADESAPDYHAGQLCTGDRFDLLSVRCDSYLERQDGDDGSAMFEFTVDQAMVEFCADMCFIAGWDERGTIGTSDYLQFEPQ